MVKRFCFFLVFLSTVLFNASVLASTPEIELSLSKDTVWQREQVLATLVIKSSDKLSRIEAEEFEQDGFTIVPVDMKRVEDENGVTTTLKWFLFAYLAERQKLELPRIRYRPSTSRPVELELPEQFLNVRPLPIYVPPTMPVGEVALQQSWDDGFIVSAKKLFDWQVKAESQNVSPQTLPAISRQLVSSPRLQVFPHEKQIEQSQNKKGIQIVQQYTIPIKGLTAGRIDFPKIEIQYFDPINARLNKVTIDTPPVFALFSWMIWSGLIVLALLGIWLGSYFLPKLRSWYTCKQQKKRALENLSAAKNYHEIKKSLSEFASAKGLHANSALEVFAEAFKNTGAHAVIKSHMQTINEIQFSSNENNQAVLESAKSLSKILAKL